MQLTVLFNLCHSLEGNAGALTNFEVLDFLRAKEASKDPTRGIAKVAQSEYKVYDYLVDSAASVQTRESINEFLTSVKQHDLTKTEVLNILNIGPAADFELYPDQAGKVPLYWGITADGYVAFVDDAALLKGSCGKSLASFPLGCFYSIAVGGLRCYENPKNKIVAIPAKEEEIRGAFFKV
ncbi:DNA-directed RNA polymerase III subunit RPC9 [Glycine max]|nr:DNA-directed RNA polymerase III subunit RPC9 [Glycine max]